MPRPSTSAVLISTATASSLLGDQVLYSVLPVYFESLGLSAIQVGVVLSANRWIRLGTNHLAHVVTARVRGDVLLVLALLLGAATTAIYTQAQWFSLLLTARLAWGLAWSFIRHVGVLAIMSEVPRDMAGRTMGYYNGISRFGSVLGLFGGALLVDLLGFASALWILAAVSLAFVPFGRAGIRRVVLADRTEQGADDESARHSGIFMVLGIVIGAVGSGFVMSTLGAAFAARFGDGGAIFGLTAASLTGGLLAVRFVLDSAAAPWLGAVTDRIGARKAATMFMALGGLALFGAAASDAVMLMGSLVIGFFIAGTALNAGVAGIAGSRGSGAFSRFATALDFGAALGPLVGWWALDVTNVDTIGLWLGGATYTACAFVAYAGLRPERATR